jgi:hypothetical protein
MAKFELKFLDRSTNKVSLTVYNNSINEIEIIIDYIGNVKDDIEDQRSVICLDKSTAIKFAKTLRTEINKITEQEVKDDKAN